MSAIDRNRSQRFWTFLVLTILLVPLHYARNEEERKRVIDVLCCESCV